ncbi:MAG: hypothetical protein FWF97_03415 [Alphaproteobacteria bacterium]|nr:hypothetical protein [Alphaproteobacteria bacterium]
MPNKKFPKVINPILALDDDTKIATRQEQIGRLQKKIAETEEEIKGHWTTYNIEKLTEPREADETRGIISTKENLIKKHKTEIEILKGEQKVIKQYRGREGIEEIINQRLQLVRDKISLQKR